MIHNN